MIKCANCGAELTPDTNFCTACGARVDVTPAAPQTPVQPPKQPTPTYKAVTPAPAPVQTPVYQAAPSYTSADAPPPEGSKYEPVSTFGFIGIMLLMCIPIVGQLLTLLWAFGGCKKVQKRNFARASLFFMVISLIFTIFIGLKIKAFVDKVNDNIHAVTGQMADTLNLEEIADILTGVENVASGNSDDAEGVLSDIGSFAGENSDGLAAILGALGDGEGEGLQALAALSALTGGGSDSEGGLDLEALAALASLAESNDSGNGTTEGTASLDDLVSEIESINAEASAMVIDRLAEPFEAFGGDAGLLDYYKDNIFMNELDAEIYVEIAKNPVYTYANVAGGLGADIRQGFQDVLYNANSSVTEGMERFRNMLTELIEEWMIPNYEAVYGNE